MKILTFISLVIAYLSGIFVCVFSYIKEGGADGSIFGIIVLSIIFAIIANVLYFAMGE